MGKGTYEEARRRGLQRGVVAVAPTCEGFALARVFDYRWQYVMVRYPSGAVRGYVPAILVKATDAQAAAFWEQMRAAETEQSRTKVRGQ